MSEIDTAKGMAGAALNLARPRGNTVVLIGDSRTNQSTSIGTDTTKNTNLHGLFFWWNTLSGGKYFLLNEAGVDGERTDQILARIASEVGAYRPSICLYEGGVNDIAQGVSPETAYGYIVQTCQALLAMGTTPVVLTVTPWDASYASLPSASGRAKLDNLNAYIRNLPWEVPGTLVSDVAGALTDPATGYAKANVHFDGLHYASYGAQLGGAQIKADVDAFFCDASIGSPSMTDSYLYNSSSKQTLGAHLFMRTDGSGSASSGGTAGTGVSGTIASGFGVSRVSGTPTVVCSLVARSDGYGFNQRMEITAGANGDVVKLEQIISGGRAAIGDWLSAEAEIAVTSATNLRGVYVESDSNVAGKTSRVARAGAWSSTASVANNISAYVGRQKTVPHQIDPTGSTINSTVFAVYVGFNGAGGATVDVGRASMRKAGSGDLA